MMMFSSPTPFMISCSFMFWTLLGIAIQLPVQKGFYIPPYMIRSYLSK